MEEDSLMVPRVLERANEIRSNSKEIEMDSLYDNIIIGGGKAGKTLAPVLVANG
ncbi:hypothetical protein [Nostoc sp. T09]|uniref:hypothetical protein n=1 Tax=Nostoc sp. T09 TaxID=1932621 RepID=UPI0015C51599|nr:hypothetical protein [Nostoc sp. T09]